MNRGIRILKGYVTRIGAVVYISDPAMAFGFLLNYVHFIFQALDHGNERTRKLGI